MDGILAEVPGPGGKRSGGRFRRHGKIKKRKVEFLKMANGAVDQVAP